MNNGFNLLRNNHAGTMLLKSGGTVNYGVIRIENETLIYYTGMGLREIWAPNMTEQERLLADDLKKKPEEELVRSGHVAKTPLKEIERVIF